MIFSSKAKKSIVWMVMVCIIAMVSMPMFLYAESGAYKLIVDDNTYELVNEPYENYMGLIVNAEDLMNAFELQYEFDDAYKSFEIFCEDASIMLMHEATHYYKGEESIECLPYFFVENGPMIELGLFCEIFGKEYSYNKDEKIISIKQKEKEISVAEETETPEVLEEKEIVEETESFEEDLSTEFIETEIDLENDKTEELIEESLAPVANDSTEPSTECKLQQEVMLFADNAAVHGLSGTITLPEEATEGGLQISLILQPASTLKTTSYGVNYYSMGYAYNIGSVYFERGETSKDYKFEVDKYYSDSDYPNYVVYYETDLNNCFERYGCYETDGDTGILNHAPLYGDIRESSQIKAFEFGKDSVAHITVSTLTSNKCGPDANWEFDSDSGVLTISGTGEMYDYYDLSPAWYQSSVAHLVVEEGITSIGDFAFYHLANLRTIQLPKSLENIGVCAFSDCNRLTSVSMSEGVRVIDICAFSSCENLTMLFLPETLLEVGRQAFDECYNLTDVFYGGSEDDWNALFIDDWNDDLTNADIVCTNGAQSLFKTGSHGMIINGKNCTSEATPVWINGKMFAPVRPVADSVGATAEWNGTLRTLTFTKDDISVAYSNEDENITNVDGRVYVSVDDVWCDFFGPGYEWMTWMSDWGEWCMSARNLSEVEDIITVVVDKAKGKAGQVITVPVCIENNPGIAGLQLNLSYDEKLTLTNINWTNTLSKLEFTPPGDYSANPLTFIWDGLNADNSNGRILTLMFSTDEYAEEGFYPILIETVENGIYGDNLENVECKVINGGISIINYLPGDINGDGVVGTKDVTVLRRYIAGGYDVTVVNEALDVNGDSTITTKDVTTLRRFIAGGYGVELN